MTDEETGRVKNLGSEPRPDPSPLRIVVPASRYPVTIRVVGQVGGVEFDGVDEYCPPDLPQVRVYLDIVQPHLPPPQGPPASNVDADADPALFAYHWGDPR